MKTMFVRTRQTYDSYQDFWKLVELSGFDTCFVDQVQFDQENLYIFPTVNAEVRFIGGVGGRIESECKARFVWWSLERPDSSKERLAEIGKGVYTGLEDALPLFDFIWSSDTWWVGQQQMPQKVIFVPMGSHVGLADKRWSAEGPFAYDYCHFSYVAGRRGPIHSGLSMLRAGQNGWGEERGRILRASRLLVNIHQTPVSMGEPLRFAVAAAYGIPMISEECYSPYPLMPGVDFIPASYENIVPITLEATKESPKDLQQIGDSMHKRLCVDHLFKTEVQIGALITEGTYYSRRSRE